MKQKRLYLHIGTHKTGTTSIQFFCYDNREKLEKLGYLYPKTGCKWKGHHELAWAAGVNNPNKRNDISDAELWEMLAQEIILSTAENIIISSEDFEWVWNTKQLKYYLSEFDVKIIIYLRRQDNYIQSFYSTHIKDYRPRISKEIEEYAHTLKLNTLNYYDYLKNWEKSFGSENIIVRVFEKQQLPNGLLADFLNTVGISSTKGFIITDSHKTSNKSLHPECLDFLRLCNRMKMNEKKHIELRKIVEVVSDTLNDTTKSAGKHLMHPKLRLEIINTYKKQNEKTAKHFLQRNDGQIFYEDLPKIDDDWVGHFGVSTETMVMIFASLWGRIAD